MAAAFLSAGCAEREAEGADDPAHRAVDERTRLDALVARCTEDMVRQTCRTMGLGGVAPAPDGDVVFVAGIGAVEVSVYERLRADGSGRCEPLRRSCATDPAGSACRTALALYGDDTGGR